MQYWTVDTWKQEMTNENSSILLKMRGKSKGLVIDCRKIPTPTVTIWKHETKADSMKNSGSKFNNQFEKLQKLNQ